MSTALFTLTLIAAVAVTVAVLDWLERRKHRKDQMERRARRHRPA